MNETLTNQTYNWANLSTEIGSEIIREINLTESIVFLIIYMALAVLTYKIFTNTNKINKEIKYKSVNYFAKSFQYYFGFFILVGILEIISISTFFIEPNYSFLTIIAFLTGTILVMLPWIGRTYLFKSILYKYFEKDLPTKFAQKMFFFFIAFLVAADFILYVTSFLISPYLFVIYTLTVLAGFIYYIYKKEGNTKKITSQLPHLTIILLLFLRLTNVVDFFTQDDKLLLYFEYFNSILTFIIYSFILIRLKKWRKVLTDLK